MPSSQAKRALGTKLKMGDGASPEVFTAIAEIISIQQQGQKIDLIDVTNMDSEANANGLIYREFIGGLADGGELSFSANFIPTNDTQQDFMDAFDGLKKRWRVVLPDDLGYFSCEAFINANDFDYSIDKQLGFSGKLKVSGPYGFTEGAEP